MTSNLTVKFVGAFVRQWLLLALMTGALTAQSKSWVSGRIVDRNGKPVVGANITPLASCSGCTDDAVEVSQTDGDGAFRMWINSPVTYRLYITTPQPNGFWQAIHSPENSLLKLREFRGVRFTLREGTNLGMLRPTFEFVGVTVDLVRSGIFGPESNAVTRGISVRIKDRLGNIVVSPTAVPDKYLDEHGILSIALPIGEWTLDVYSPVDGKPKRSGSFKIAIDAEHQFKVSRTSGEKRKTGKV